MINSPVLVEHIEDWRQESTKTKLVIWVKVTVYARHSSLFYIADITVVAMEFAALFYTYILFSFI